MLISQQLDRSRHIIDQGEPAFMTSVRNQFPKFADTLFFMFNRANGHSGICGWTQKDQGLFVSLHGRKGLEKSFSRADMEALRETLYPQTPYFGSDGVDKIQKKKDAAEKHELETLTRARREAKRSIYHKNHSGVTDDPWFDDVR
jgi:hypothetical protein